MAHCVVVQCVSYPKKQGALIIRVHLAAFVRCFKIQREGVELCVAVITEKSALHVRCCRQRDVFREVHGRVKGRKWNYLAPSGDLSLQPLLYLTYL